MRARRIAVLASAMLLALPVAPRPALSGPRVKDIARIEGVRGNSLLGYGLVVGLKGTGDRRQTLFTAQSLRNLLERQGVSLPPRSLRVANVAGVVVTATLPPFAAPGTPLDVNVASIGDAKSLRGGVLLLTPLSGPDGQVYATAQGPLVVGGLAAESPGGLAGVETNHPTVGRIAGGALTERAGPGTLRPDAPIAWTLVRPDFATAKRLERAIDAALGPGTAQALDSRKVAVRSPRGMDPVSLAAIVEELRIDLDPAARIVVNERTGTVVAGAAIRLRPVSIVHGGLVVEVRSELGTSQPGPLSGGTTVVTSHDSVDVYEKPARSLLLGQGATIEELVQGLVALGATASDVISVLQALRDAGAMDAEIEVS